MEFEIVVEENELRKLRDELLDTITDFIFTKSQENLVKNIPWGDEKYPSTRKPSKISDTGFLLASGKVPTKHRIVYDAMYADWVEFGTPPHPINPEVLKKWVRRKLKVKGKKVDEVCNRIAWKIRRHGIAPHPFVRPAINEAKKEFG